MRLAFTHSGGDGGRGSWLAFAALLFVGATILRSVLAPPGATPPAVAPAGATIESTQPVLIEPPGGPIIWGVTTASTTISVDGTVQVLRHPGGTGAMIRFQIPMECAGGDLEVVRTVPNPRVVSHRDAEPAPMAYVPDGIYELTAVCGHARQATTRLEISSVTR
jgi:hypothetical protein